jgi:hypothetical protein
VPKVEFLWWRECPSWERALALLREEMEAAGLDPASVEVIEVESDEVARTQRFPGSPTIRIDGEDVQAPGDNPIGLSCRVYRRRDGRVSPLPDREDIRERIAAATSS